VGSVEFGCVIGGRFYVVHQMDHSALNDNVYMTLPNLPNRYEIINDGTGAASRPLLKKKAELEALGYETMMVMIYVSPMTSLERNANRDRSLMPSIVLRTWRDINSNIETYEQAFGDNLVIINNDPKDADKS
jgi:hypothetical protein